MPLVFVPAEDLTREGECLRTIIENRYPDAEWGGEMIQKR